MNGPFSGLPTENDKKDTPTVKDRMGKTRSKSGVDNGMQFKPRDDTAASLDLEMRGTRFREQGMVFDTLIHCQNVKFSTNLFEAVPKKGLEILKINLGMPSLSPHSFPLSAASWLLDFVPLTHLAGIKVKSALPVGQRGDHAEDTHHHTHFACCLQG